MRALLLAATAFLAVAASEPPAHAQRVNFTYTGKLVTWKVPKTGIYQIVAFGAQGGSGAISMLGPVSPGGLGAEIGGNFRLIAGEVLQLAVGGAGGTPDFGGGGGGGGGSFVVDPGNTPLVIAGGGGGGFAGFINNFLSLPGQGGLTGPDGGAGAGQAGLSGGAGGTGGNGGGAGFFLAGGGVGGFLSAGGTSQSGGGGGGAFPDLSGGSGGGGFGGGGGAGSSGAGGGGGYSGGGGGGPDHQTAPGGGGGSFNAGTDQILVADIWPGNGEVIIMKVSPQFAGTPGKANCHGKSVSALAKQYGGLNGAAAALGFDSVDALQGAIEDFCEA
jgi:hypothetical protein